MFDYNIRCIKRVRIGSCLYKTDGIIIDIKAHTTTSGILAKRLKNRGETMNETLLKKDNIRKKIRLNISELKKKYPINHLYLFGSYARDEQTENSDIDILVDFSKPIGFQFVHLAKDLETLLDKKIDLVSMNGINVLHELDKYIGKTV